jgi:hypothetical protein
MGKVKFVGAHVLSPNLVDRFGWNLILSLYC